MGVGRCSHRPWVFVGVDGIVAADPRCLWVFAPV